MWVVKLGGSLMFAAELSGWLDMLADVGRGRVVVVPGGGPFADRVRRAQARRALGQRVAHRLALRATERYARWLIQQCPGLTAAGDVRTVHRCLSAGRVPIWMADHLMARELGVPASWDVTSDSVAAWCSGRLAAADLVLVKSTPVLPAQVALAQLCASGLVDRAFFGFVRPQVKLWVCNRLQYRALGDALAHSGCPGTAVTRQVL